MLWRLISYRCDAMPNSKSVFKVLLARSGGSRSICMKTRTRLARSAESVREFFGNFFLDRLAVKNKVDSCD